jgi:hypothetical protein
MKPFISALQITSSRLIWGLITVGLIGSYFLYNPSDLNYVGLPLLLKHILDILSVLLLFLIASAVGWLVLSRLDLLSDMPIENFIFSIAIGFGVISNLILLLGLIGALQKAYLCILFLILIFITSNQIKYFFSLATSLFSSSSPEAFSRLIIYFSLITTIGAALFMLIFALAPPVDWDTLMYHIQLPTRFLEAKRIYVPEDNLAVSYIGMAHMLYLPLLAVGNVTGPALISMFTALLLGIACFSLSNRYFDDLTAGLCLSLLWGTTTILLVAATPRIDVTLCFYTLLAHYALHNTLFSKSTPRYYYLSAILLGLAFGIKYSALVYAMCISPLIIWGAFRRTNGILIPFKRLIIFGFIFGLTMIPWMAKNWLLFRAPLYPFFSEQMFDPWLVPWDAFVAPGRATLTVEGAFYYPNPFLLGLPFCVFFIKTRPLIWLVLPAFLFLAILRIFDPAINLRYLLPVIAPFTIAVAYTLTRLIKRLSKKKAAAVLILLFATIGLIPTARTAFLWFSKTKALNHAVGLTSPAKYLKEYKIDNSPYFVRVMNFINENLPKDSYILMLYEARGFYFQPHIIQDNKTTNWPLLMKVLSPDECLENLEVTHVLINDSALNYYLKRGANPPTVQLKELYRFMNRCLSNIYKTPSHKLFEVK